MIERVKYIINSGENGLNWLAIGPLIFFFGLLITIIFVTLLRNKQTDDYDAHLPLEEDE